MTGPEAKKQDQLFEFVREWREDDRLWKEDAGQRLRTLEDARLAEQSRREGKNALLGLGRAGLAIIVSLVGATISVLAFLR